MASRPTPLPTAQPEPSLVRLVHDGVLAIASCRTIRTAMLAALDGATASAGDAVVARGLLHGVTGDDEVVGPVGGSTQRRVLLDRFLASEADRAPLGPTIAGVRHITRAPVALDGLQVGLLEVYFFEASARDEFGLVLGALARAVGLVAVAERDERRVRDQLQLIGNLSHELRTPLTTLLGYTDILRKSWRELDDAERERELEVLDRQARRMVRLSLEVGAIAMTGDVGTLELRFDRVDLAAAIGIAVTDLLDEHEIRIRCVDGLWVRADPDRLQQMLLNLISNALAHGSPPIEIEPLMGRPARSSTSSWPIAEPGSTPPSSPTSSSRSREVAPTATTSTPASACPSFASSPSATAGSCSTSRTTRQGRR